MNYLKKKNKLKKKLNKLVIEITISYKKKQMAFKRIM